MKGKKKKNAGRGRPLGVAESYVDELVVVTLLEIVKDGGVVEVGQVGHVLGFLILGRVHLLQLVLLEVLALVFVRIGGGGRKNKSVISLNGTFERLT